MIQLCLRLTPEEFADLQAFAGARGMDTEETGRLLVTRQPVPEFKPEPKSLAESSPEEFQEAKRRCRR